MHKPGTWVIGSEGDGYVAFSGEEGYVSAGGVFVVEEAVCEVGGVEGDGLLGEDGEVVSVEMDLLFRVRKGTGRERIFLGKGGWKRKCVELTGWETGKNLRELSFLEALMLAVMIRYTQSFSV